MATIPTAGAVTISVTTSAICPNRSSFSASQFARLFPGCRRAIPTPRYGDPALILLDEPDSNLDGRALNTLITTLKWLKERGRMIIVTSHRQEMLRSADRVILLDNGAVAKIAVPAPLPAADLSPPLPEPAPS
mgnify:CR=1 FL=1